jgi:putative acetyltransferase
MEAGIEIRAERPGDVDAVRALTIEAFTASELGYGGEAEIIARLRANCPGIVSLVADAGGVVVGHILFSPASLAGIDGMGLAPMAVAPGHQDSGIGSSLVRAGLDLLREAGCPYVIVLGHPDYYPRFGFETASALGVTCEYEGVPDEAFMINILDRARTSELGGVARYRPEFGDVG